MNQKIKDLIFNDGGIARIYCWSSVSKYKPTQVLYNYRRIAEAEAWESTNNVLMTVNAAFFADRAEHLMNWNPEKSAIKTWVINLFSWWYLDWMKKQINYDNNVKKNIKGFYDESYYTEAQLEISNKKQEEIEMLADWERMMDRMAMFAKTRNEAERWIFAELNGFLKIQLTEDRQRALNYPGKANCGIATYYRHRNKFLAELKAFCNGDY